MRFLISSWSWKSLQAVILQWQQRSLANRMVWRSQLIAFGVLFVSSLVFYPITVVSLQESAELKLRLVGTRVVQKLESELERIVGEAMRLSRLSLVANALGDNSGNQAYLVPFLAEYHQNMREASSPALVDSRGNVLGGEIPQAVATAFLKDGILPSQPVVVFRPEIDAGQLYLAYPVVFHATGSVEGMLVSQVDLRSMLSRIVKEESADRPLPLNIRLTSADGALSLVERGYIGQESGTVLIPVHTESQELRSLQLSVKATTDPVKIYRPLALITLLLILVISAVFAVGVFLSRRLAAKDIEPLRELGRHAMEIANAGASGLKELEVIGSDEIASLAVVFNEMVYSLRLVYDQQEELVAERTKEVRLAREHLRSVLDGIDDVVYALRRDDLKIDYISASSRRLLGVDAGELQRSTSTFFNMVLEEDRAWLFAALDDLQPGQIQEIRYRVRHADGRIRLVMNRMNLILDSQGEMNRVGGLIRDITDAVASETMLHLRERALASASCGVVISDMMQPGQPIIYVNAAFEHITGYSAEDVLGRNCKLLQRKEEIEPDTVLTVRDAIRRGDSCKVVLRNWRKDGSSFWNELQLSPLFDENGIVTHYIGIQNDISATIAATQALVESEQRLMLTVDALHEGIWDWSIQDDSLVTSPSWARVLGLDPDRLERRHSLATFLDRLAPVWQDKIKSALEDHFAGGTEDFYIEHQCELPDGRVIWAASHGRVVERSVDGRPLRMVGSIVDITDRIESTDRIIGLMSQLDVILTLSPDGIIYFDDAGRISFVNRAFERMTGIKAGDATGLTRQQLDGWIRERADPRHPYPDCFFSDSCGCNVDSSAGTCLLYTVKPQHSVLQISVHEPAEGSAIVIYLHDVTRETEVDRMKSEFLSTAAHELRTPMTSILGYVELLRMREFERDAALRVYDTIHRQARRLTELINELLDLARIEARRGSAFNIQDVAPNEVLKEAIVAMKAMNGEVGAARLEITIEADLPRIQADPAKLQQACINIISNAFKYSPGGGPIEIRAQPEPRESRPGVVIQVRDHGIGMAPADLERVFERFFRADGSGNIPGTGLGMSLVKEIIDAHHGDIKVDSELGAGTLVSIWLPAENEVESQSAANLGEVTPHHMGDMTLWLESDNASEAVKEKA